MTLLCISDLTNFDGLVNFKKGNQYPVISYEAEEGRLTAVAMRNEQHKMQIIDNSLPDNSLSYFDTNNIIR